MSNQSHLQDGPALGSELTASSRAPALPSNSNYATEGPIRNKIEYNYKYPTLQPDGTVIIEANFMDRNKENKRVMIAKNCEVPLELKLRGRLPDKMDKKIQYRRCRSREPFFVQQGNNKNYNGEFIGEEAIHAMPDVERSFNHLREIIFRRSEGEFTNQSHFEMILAGTHGKFGPDGRRDYRLGFTQDQNGQVIQGCPINSHMIKNVDLIEEFHRETAFIATKVLESSGCPRDVLDLVRRQYDVNAPCTYGSEDNKYFMANQLNLSPIAGNGVDLQITIGEVGGHHGDFNDDPTLWTVLLNLSNLPKGCDPGRILLTGLRVYADMGPNTALIFKGVHTHLPLPPGPMGESTLPPYVTKYVPELDTSKYIYGRGMNVNYPKKLGMEQSGLRLRTITPDFLIDKDGLASTFSDFLPKTSAVWGTPRNAWESKTRASAMNLTRLSRLQPQSLPPSAETAKAIALLHRWQEGGIIYGTRLEQIQAVIDANLDTQSNKEHQEKWAEYANSCEKQISQMFFPTDGRSGRGRKGGPTNWVTELGSSLSAMSFTAEPPAKKGHKKNDVPDPDFIWHPYKCPHCDKRYVRINACQNHCKVHHKGFEWRVPARTTDPNPKKRKPKANTGGPKAVEEIGHNDSGSSKRKFEEITEGDEDGHEEVEAGMFGESDENVD
ncbi:hypothetical protein DL95DRAFT_462654 [Leptodontidium sp. 2 PMI_412]|nr:hypothetical protein DL95DRAFT_462654 [Leptodontidium sp. 2 PMI_412]